ncbi:MAG: ATP-binding cassette domain-containing protein, partial [Candidatus Adiutrix sp.]|nr:ATP-binding cassette domain-containing protein [Candidatus Adiutrix sp.]
MLKLQGLHTFYGNIEALKGLDLTVEEGEIIALLGANGAGKTTTLNSISGLTPPRRGRVFFDGDDITG